MFKAIQALKPYSKPYRVLMFFGAVMTTLFALLALIDPYVSGRIIDGVLMGETSTYVITGSILLVGSTLLRAVFRYAYFMIFEEASQKIVYKLREDMYHKLQSLDFNYFDKTATGQIMSKMTGDIEAIRHFYAWSMHEALFHSVIFTFAIVSMIFINPLLTGTIVLIIPFIAYFSVRLSVTVKPTFTKIREEFSRLNTVVQENISGNRVVKAFAREPYEIHKFDEVNEAFVDVNLESARVWEKYLPSLDAFAVFFNVIVLLLGGFMVIDKKMTIGELVAFNRLLWMVNNPLRMLGWMINGFQNFAASYEKIDEFMKERSGLRKVKQPIKEPQIQGHIAFKNVNFKYDDQVVLKNIDFEVKPGETVAILGSTGSGKSTMMNLISRFYDPTSGDILLDGKSIRHYALKELRESIAIAMQDIFLFSDSIEKNIAYGRPSATEEDIKWVSKVAGIEEFIDQFEEGYETIVGERGVGLSGGQKQRIALARAILLNPSILILDDTTSAVDVETEYLILNELKKINAKRTTFMIAHRISSVKDADLILVLDQGVIIERGTHQSLLEDKGYYYSIFTQQMGDFDPRSEVMA